MLDRDQEPSGSPKNGSNSDELTVNIVSYGSTGGLLGAVAGIAAPSLIPNLILAGTLITAVPLIGAALGAGAGICLGATRLRR